MKPALHRSRHITSAARTKPQSDLCYGDSARRPGMRQAWLAAAQQSFMEELKRKQNYGSAPSLIKQAGPSEQHGPACKGAAIISSKGGQGVNAITCHKLPLTTPVGLSVRCFNEIKITASLPSSVRGSRSPPGSGSRGRRSGCLLRTRAPMPAFCARPRCPQRPRRALPP